tara:strand:- start:129 stop:485 length:357 start_codon:yes stop_codon:yes gene_type:complete
MNNTIKHNIKNELFGYNKEQHILNNNNHITLRYFSLYLNGSYDNEEEYYNNIDYVKEHKNNNKKMLSFTINKFINFMSKDFNCSYSHVQKTIVKLFNKNELEILNNKLISCSLELIED